MRNHAFGAAHNYETDLSGGKIPFFPEFESDKFDGEAWLDHTTLIDASKQLDTVFAGASIIDEFEFANITALLHYAENLPHEF